MKNRFTVVFIITFLFFTELVWAQKTPYDWALIRLDHIKLEKLESLRKFTGKLHNTALKASKDQKIVSFFEINKHYFDACKKNTPPPDLSRQVEEMRKVFDRYYLTNYFFFYNILFLNKEGDAFYSIRKGEDAYINLIENRKTVGRLGEVIAQTPHQEVFIDFYHYYPSTEPAAFFVEPVFQNGVQQGWIVLQCAINKLNSIFSPTDELGRTGESFLVNQDGFMLTESYFKGESTVLKQHLADKNIKAKFRDKAGHRIVTDYRGETALSSYEVFEFLNTKWLIVAKIDKDEITTNHYKQHKEYYKNMLLEDLNKTPEPISTLSAAKRNPVSIRVDLDEFLKAANGEQLETWGVATCTAVVATVPGRFSYLAHISPLDKIYNGSGSNILKQITKKIKKFDIYPYEWRNVVFVVVAPHFESILNIIDQLVEDGFFLSQIRIAYNPSARSVAVYSDYEQDRMIFEWTLKTDGKCFTNFDHTYNIGDMTLKIMERI